MRILIIVFIIRRMTAMKRRIVDASDNIVEIKTWYYRTSHDVKNDINIWYKRMVRSTTPSTYTSGSLQNWLWSGMNSLRQTWRAMRHGHNKWRGKKVNELALVRLRHPIQKNLVAFLWTMAPLSIIIHGIRPDFIVDHGNGSFPTIRRRRRHTWMMMMLMTMMTVRMPLLLVRWFTDCPPSFRMIISYWNVPWKIQRVVITTTRTFLSPPLARMRLRSTTTDTAGSMRDRYKRKWYNDCDIGIKRPPLFHYHWASSCYGPSFTTPTRIVQIVPSIRWTIGMPWPELLHPTHCSEIRPLTRMSWELVRRRCGVICRRGSSNNDHHRDEWWVWMNIPTRIYSHKVLDRRRYHRRVIQNHHPHPWHWLGIMVERRFNYLVNVSWGWKNCRMCRDFWNYTIPRPPDIPRAKMSYYGCREYSYIRLDVCRWLRIWTKMLLPWWSIHLTIRTTITIW